MILSEILAIHIGAGLLALFSGTAALLFRKGDSPHRTAGTVFFLSMLVLSASAIYIAAMKSLPIFIVGAPLVIYLAATAWMAARRKDGEAGVFEIVALLVAVAANVGTFILALEAASSPTGKVNGAPAAAFFAMCAVFALAAVLDVSVIVRRGVSGAQRIARHLWRMCIAMFIAVGSFFLGPGARVFPKWIRQTDVLFVPVIVVIAVMIFWLVRVLLTNWYRARRNAERGGVPL